MSSKNSEMHFNAIAEKYDFYKKKSWYYYESLKNALKAGIPNPGESSILEIGCGTGDLIASLNPKRGLGVDISKNMVEIAKKKHKGKNIKFIAGSAERLNVKGKFDFIFMADIAEHLESFGMAIKSIRGCMRKNSVLIVTTANPVWGPVLGMAEKLKLKMEEGPHKWLSKRYICSILKTNHFRIIRSDNFLLFPSYIPLISYAANSLFGRLPIIRKLGLIQLVVARYDNAVGSKRGHKKKL